MEARHHRIQRGHRVGDEKSAVDVGCDEKTVAGIEAQRMTQVGRKTEVPLAGNGVPSAGLGGSDHGTAIEKVDRGTV